MRLFWKYVLNATKSKFQESSARPCAGVAALCEVVRRLTFFHAMVDMSSAFSWQEPSRSSRFLRMFVIHNKGWWAPARIDSPVPLMHHDPDRSWILIQIAIRTQSDFDFYVPCACTHINQRILPTQKGPRSTGNNNSPLCESDLTILTEFFRTQVIFPSLFRYQKIRAQLETWQIIRNVYTKGKTCSWKVRSGMPQCCHGNLRGEPSDIRVNKTYIFSHFSLFIAVGFYLMGLTTILQCKQGYFALVIWFGQCKTQTAVILVSPGTYLSPESMSPSSKLNESLLY